MRALNFYHERDSQFYFQTFQVRKLPQRVNEKIPASNQNSPHEIQPTLETLLCLDLIFPKNSPGFEKLSRRVVALWAVLFLHQQTLQLNLLIPTLYFGCNSG